MVLRLTRVRGVPRACEALRFGELVGGHETCKGVAGVSRNLPFFTGLSRRGNVPPHMRLHVVLYDTASVGVHEPEVGLRLGNPLVSR